MFNSMYRYISVITLLVFATMNESTSSKLGDMEELLKGTLNDLPELAKSITRMKKKLQNCKIRLLMKSQNPAREPLRTLSAVAEDFMKATPETNYSNVCSKIYFNCIYCFYSHGYQMNLANNLVLDN
uniref:Uncharacterized protein n=1 Tax=Trichobilharzia regenti TaxID=157069 RepID=A0AA85JCE8_TRIRE